MCVREQTRDGIWKNVDAVKPPARVLLFVQQSSLKMLNMLRLLLIASALQLVQCSSSAVHKRRLPPQHPRSRALQQQDEDADATALRQLLLENYDKGSFPFEELWNNNNNSAAVRKGLSIQVGLNFHRVFEVDVRRSVADLIVWVRQSWTDPRLSWDPNSTVGGIETLHFWIDQGSGPGGETSEIWTPDLQLWNLETPLSESLADAHAVVSSDGHVFWSRPGHVKAVCKFVGLDDFPFDTLDCSLEIGSWTYSGVYVRPVKMDEGFTIGGSETAGESFAEFSLLSVECEEHVYPPYPVAPEEDWPVLFYHVTFQRAWQPYARGYLVLQIILNLAAFCCFWLPPQIGERMSLSITAVLAAVASELVVAANLPAASELTWFSKFSLMSLLFTALALFESAAVIYFHYHTGDDLMPSWYRWMQQQRQKRKMSTPSPESDCDEGGKKVRFSQINQMNGAAAEVTSAVDSDDSGAGVENASESSNENKKQAVTHTTNGGKKQDHDVSSLTAFTVPDSSVKRSRRESFAPELRAEMASFRTRKSIKTILGRDADDFKNAREMENNIRWQTVASRIDEAARVLFPVAFCIYLACTFSRLSAV